MKTLLSGIVIGISLCIIGIAFFTEKEKFVPIEQASIDELEIMLQQEIDKDNVEGYKRAALIRDILNSKKQPITK